MRSRNLPIIAQLHFTLHDRAKQTLPLMGTERDEIRANRCVIVSL
jgi:hypothetical protein